LAKLLTQNKLSYAVSNNMGVSTFSQIHRSIPLKSPTLYNDHVEYSQIHILTSASLLI